MRSSRFWREAAWRERVRPEPLHEALEPGDLGGLLGGLDTLALEGERPLAPEGRVAHRPQPGAAPLELEDAGGQRLQEPSVVRDQDHRRVEVADRALEPLHRGEVEVVGRLVEQQDVRRDTARRQRRPRELAAREARERARQVVLGDAEPRSTRSIQDRQYAPALSRRAWASS